MSFSGKQNTVKSQLIVNQPFWPALDLAELINQYRTPSDLPAETIATSLIQAMVIVNSRLNSYRQNQQSAGFNELESSPSEQINGQSIQLILYKRAVFCQAKAIILRDWPAIDRRSDGENLARSGEDTEDRYLQFTDEAIAHFLGRGGITVEAL